MEEGESAKEKGTVEKKEKLRRPLLLQHINSGSRETPQEKERVIITLMGVIIFF